jgi:hypothetical protein
MNPPYGRSSGVNKFGKIGKDSSNNLINSEMKKCNYGTASSQLYTQFLYRVWDWNIRYNANISIAAFTKTLFLTGSSYKKFRVKFFNTFEYKNGYVMNSAHFDGTSSWDLSFTIWKPGKTKITEFPVDILDLNVEDIPSVMGVKSYYNTDKVESLSDWFKEDITVLLDLLNTKKIKTQVETIPFTDLKSIRANHKKLTTGGVKGRISIIHNQ